MKYLGVDFGLRKVGLAVSEGNLASPYKVIEVGSLKGAVEQVAREARKGGFEMVVVGLPEGKMGKMVNGFINGLRKKGLEAVETDETLSTQKASARMIESNTPKHKRRGTDAAAAAIILQEYLDQQ